MIETIEKGSASEVLDPKDIQGILDIGRRQTYELLADAPFQVVKIGRLYKIPKKTFYNWLEGKQGD